MILKKYALIVLLSLLALVAPSASFARVTDTWLGTDFSGKPCEGEDVTYGPFDYTNATDRAKKLPIVEEYHFTKNIELLIKGNTSTVPGDIHYTLGAFPNHHKALKALMYYQLLNKSGLKSPMECYFQRAIHFSPHDMVSYSLYASYLKKIKRVNEADSVYKQAIAFAPNNLGIKYLYGLFLWELKKYPEALAQAQAVYQNNYPKQKLKQLLVKSGHWQK